MYTLYSSIKCFKRELVKPSVVSGATGFTKVDNDHIDLYALLQCVVGIVVSAGH